jgi:phosphopantetheinyl transferase
MRTADPPWTTLSVPAPGFDHVRCVLVRGLGDGEFDSWAWLAPDERIQAEGMRRASRRADWLAGRLAAKLAIRQALESELELARISVSYEPGGRPLAVHAGSPLPRLWLAISHSRGVALAAAGRGTRPIGVDLEHPTDRVEELADYALADAERERLRAPVTARSMLAHWTLKEAALKALGVGLRVHPRRLAVDADCCSAAAVASWRLAGPVAEGAGAGWFEHRGPFTWAVADVDPTAA